ncbi:MAG: M1 family aminopeptidase [Rhodospirillales bacterium]|nr:M1 family aminopeptidase [Rhodospirillales bacterium]
MAARHEIEARLDPRNGEIEVRDVVTLRASGAATFSYAPWLAVQRLRVDGKPAQPTAGPEGWRVSLAEGERHEIELRLTGTLPPLPAEPQGGAAGSAGSGPEGSYLPGWSAWFPDFGHDRVAYRLSVEVPTGFKAVASGRLEAERSGELGYRAVFVADDPAEPPSLFAGPYEVREARAGRIRLRTYFHPELAALAEAYLNDSARYLLRFEERIGPYPFEDFHVISAPLPVGLGFPNLTYVGRRVLPLPFMRGRSLAHEVLHNWWGNGVAVDYDAGNWAEGLTTYMADYALAADSGRDEAREMRLAWLRDYAALPAERDTPVTAFKSKRHEASQVVGYNKVAFIFHMLEVEIGEAAFTTALRRFWRYNRFRTAGWEALRAAFEAASGRDLEWFFRQWLRQAGAPRLQLVGATSEAREGGYRLNLSLRQGEPAYRLAVPLVVETDEGPVYEKIELTEAKATLTVDLAARPLEVRIDPGHDLFRRLLPGEAPPILRDVTLAPDAITIIAADDEKMGSTAFELAQRLLDTQLRLGAADEPQEEPVPLLVIGAATEVEAYLARAGMAGTPEGLAGRGTARVWTARQDSGKPLLVVAADTPEAMAGLLRPLPHYGGKSYLVFEGGQAVEQGVWKSADSPLRRRLEP